MFYGGGKFPPLVKHSQPVHREGVLFQLIHCLSAASCHLSLRILPAQHNGAQKVSHHINTHGISNQVPQLVCRNATHVHALRLCALCTEKFRHGMITVQPQIEISSLLTARGRKSWKAILPKARLTPPMLSVHDDVGCPRALTPLLEVVEDRRQAILPCLRTRLRNFRVHL